MLQFALEYGVAAAGSNRSSRRASENDRCQRTPRLDRGSDISGSVRRSRRFNERVQDGRRAQSTHRDHSRNAVLDRAGEPQHQGPFQRLVRFDPPDLAEVSMSGFMEWARFWCLLGQRQEWDEEAGQHWLWLRTGGSAGHAGLWHLDVTEGKRSDPGGRRWESSIVRASEGNRNIQAAEGLMRHH